jgi:hypothetical protein
MRLILECPYQRDSCVSASNVNTICYLKYWEFNILYENMKIY